MTIMRLALAGVRLTPDQKERLAERLLGEFAAVEVGNDSPAIRRGFVVVFEELASEDVWMGDGPMTRAGTSGRAALLQTQVMAGPWTDEMKAELFARLERVIREEVDMPRPEGGADFWTTFVEVPEGAWGLGGQPVSIARLAPVFSADRQARIEEHLKSR